uniref:Uncharacterized protein n=1 Tax=Rhizophora mucronata TaxID=61149 RepID=A0A2P2PRJ9_RHIMU
MFSNRMALGANSRNTYCWMNTTQRLPFLFRSSQGYDNKNMS